jgi:hypothetical protein
MWVGLEWGAWVLNPKYQCPNNAASVLMTVVWSDEDQEEV